MSDSQKMSQFRPIHIPLENRKKRPKQISYVNPGSHRGNRRLWLEGLRLADAGFKRGATYRFTPIPEMFAGTLDLCKPGGHTHTVSGRERKGKGDEKPIVDINSKELTELLEGIETVRVMYYENRLLLQAHSSELNAMTSIEDLEINTAARKLTMGVIGVGGGVFSSAMKEGLAEEGIDIETSWIIDIENNYLQNVIDNTSTVGPNTIVVEGDASDVEVGLLTPVNIFWISIACTGFSPAGKAKNQLLHAEEHEKSGLMILPTIDIIKKYMPPVIWFENVPAFNTSHSAALFFGTLRKLGYNIDGGMYGNEMGTLETRRRSIICATHKSLKFDLQNHLLPVATKEETLREVMEEVPLDSDMWKPYDYLTKKAVRDAEAGKGFKLQRLTGDESEIGTMGAGMAKARSTEPFFIHPENPNLFRLPTVNEHAAFMKIPPSIVANQSKTIAHQILGQSGSYALVKAIGVMTGKELNCKYNNQPIVLDQHLLAEADARLDRKVTFEFIDFDDPDIYENDSGDQEISEVAPVNHTMSLF
jgi:DNA (cytosine-5)-methyltransferase 1